MQNSIFFDQKAQSHNQFRFCHKAMATLFEIIINHGNYTYAAQAVQAAFAEIDRLENELSRFIENSDISRINALRKNESIVIGIDTFECLENCSDIQKLTTGAFDISTGYLINKYKNGWKPVVEFGSTEVSKPSLKLDRRHYRVTSLVESIDLDLGGFGKGYAIDVVSKTLLDWDLQNFLIHGGMSTVLASKKPASHKSWQFSFSNPLNQKPFYQTDLDNYSVSSSGIEKGQHILNPQTMLPVKDRLAAWVFAPTASLSDALSTAFMILPVEQIKDICRENVDISAMIIEKENKEETIFIGNYFNRNNINL